MFLRYLAKDSLDGMRLRAVWTRKSGLIHVVQICIYIFRYRYIYTYIYTYNIIYINMYLFFLNILYIYIFIFILCKYIYCIYIYVYIYIIYFYIQYIVLHCTPTCATRSLVEPCRTRDYATSPHSTLGYFLHNSGLLTETESARFAVLGLRKQQRSFNGVVFRAFLVRTVSSENSSGNYLSLAQNHNMFFLPVLKFTAGSAVDDVDPSCRHKDVCASGRTLEDVVW